MVTEEVTALGTKNLLPETERQTWVTPVTCINIYETQLASVCVFVQCFQQIPSNKVTFKEHRKYVKQDIDIEFHRVLTMVYDVK